ncbi:glutamate--tRNA ligase family protein [Candidatus Carsonella ruddii]|uniref:Putative glutamyl-tRNA synthetase n=1 Tax=Candidatus Carsonella ruddii HC isolate Thao2000 TaxID=1202538 RepID=J3Z163_CARRU|nr:glutamate--tRNA ligase family protein [Candidatus Carsonella ruddii]AFP83969.1 putative glutamyl-tRNA synthetase [Candidatus Carsonella ruddii HC isolate Thao2000]
MNFNRIAITPSGVPHLGNIYIFFINYILKNKILNNLFLRIDDTNKKNNKNINIFFIIKNLKKNGIFFKKILKQTNFINYYIKKNFFKKKNCYKKIFINNKIKKKNLSYSINIIINNSKIFFFDNNFKLLKYKIFFHNFVFIRSNMIPIYHYSSIIDDNYNNVNLILRGKEWLNQIPFQLNLIKKIKLKINFHHISNINNLNNKKLSKRNCSKNTLNNIFFFKKNKLMFFNNKDYKFISLEKKKKTKTKINNYIMINLLYFIKNINIENFSLFLKSKILYLKDAKIEINFSNLNFFSKIFKNLKELDLNNKILLFINNIKKYEFI